MAAAVIQRCYRKYKQVRFPPQAYPLTHTHTHAFQPRASRSMLEP